MAKRISFGSTDTIGLDVGDQFIHFCEVRGGVVKTQHRIPNSEESLAKFLASRRPCRIVVEIGKHSPWIHDLLANTPFESIFVNAAKLMSLHQLKRKTDKLDARYLASRGSLNDPNVFESRVIHRTAPSRHALTVIRARDVLVELRSKAVVATRALVASAGGKLPSCSPESFAQKKVIKAVPRPIFDAIEPLISAVDALTKEIRKHDRKIESIARNQYPKAIKLAEEAQGVGVLTALTFVLLIDDITRFTKGKSVGSYFGLTPGVHESGDQIVELGITKEGDDLMRRLLVQCAHYIMSRGEDSDLRRFGERILERNARGGKKRAIIAVARKLAVILFHLLKTGKTYDPLHNSKKSSAA